MKSLLGLLTAALGAVPTLPAQCTDEGSRAVAEAWQHGPPLGCTRAAHAPAWVIYTPPHRTLVPRAGWTFVEARVRPRVIVRYTCTDLWLAPVVPYRVHNFGYVFDMVVAPCR